LFANIVGKHVGKLKELFREDVHVRLCARVDINCFGLSREDAQDKDQLRLKVREEPANLG